MYELHYKDHIPCNDIIKNVVLIVVISAVVFIALGLTIGYLIFRKINKRVRANELEDNYKKWHCLTFQDLYENILCPLFDKHKNDCSRYSDRNNCIS